MRGLAVSAQGYPVIQHHGRGNTLDLAGHLAEVANALVHLVVASHFLALALGKVSVGLRTNGIRVTGGIGILRIDFFRRAGGAWRLVAERTGDAGCLGPCIGLLQQPLAAHHALRLLGVIELGGFLGDGKIHVQRHLRLDFAQP